jgi:hypothetical protein
MAAPSTQRDCGSGRGEDGAFEDDGEARFLNWLEEG